MMTRVRDCLLIFLLAVLAGSVGTAGWKLVILLDRVEDSLVLAEDTLRIGRSALAEQRIYYRALSKMVVLDANRLGKAIGSAEQAIRNEDARLAETHRQFDQLAAELQRTASAGTETIQQTAAASAALAAQIDVIGGESRQFVAEGTAVLTAVDERLQDPSISQTSGNLAQSAANLERMSAAGAESAERVRDILNPKKRSFWVRVLELIIPRPTVRVGR